MNEKDKNAQAHLYVILFGLTVLAVLGIASATLAIYLAVPGLHG